MHTLNIHVHNGLKAGGQALNLCCPSPWTWDACVLSPTSGFCWLAGDVNSLWFSPCPPARLPDRYRSLEPTTTTKGEVETNVTTPWKVPSLVVAMLPSFQLGTRLIRASLVPFVLDINGMSLRTCQFDLYSTSVLVIQTEVRKKWLPWLQAAFFNKNWIQILPLLRGYASSSHPFLPFPFLTAAAALEPRTRNQQHGHFPHSF